MTQAVTYIAVQHDSSREAGAIQAEYIEDDSSADRRACVKLSRMFHRMALGLEPGKVTVLQDDYATFGTIDVAVVVASCAAGDWLYVGPVGLRCVTGAVTALQDTWTKDTGNTEGAVSLAAAINNNVFLAQYVTASNPTAGTVRITSNLPGPICHLIAVRKEVATAAGLVIAGEASRTLGCLTTSTGGSKASATVTCVLANTDDADTVTLCGKVLTGDTTTPADADEFEVATSATNMGNTMTTAINAAEEIRGHGWADNVAGVVTFTAYVPGTGVNAATLASSDADGLAVSGATLTDGTTAALKAPRSHGRGLA